jgi:chromosome partitioning protein
MEQIKESFTLKSSDLRQTLGIAPATLSDLFKKVGVNFIEEDKNSRGQTKNILANDVRKIFELRGYKYPDSAKVISLMMCKGGVGKTTTTVFVSQRLSSYGAKVLLIDADSQGNATSALNLEQYGYSIDEQTPVLLDIFIGNSSIQETIIKISPNLHVIPSSPANSTLDGKIRETFKNTSIALKKFLDQVIFDYDFILIDCAPALNLTNTAMVSASELVIMPVAPDKFSQMGLEQTLSEISQIESDFKLKIDKKIVFTKFDAREYTSLKYLTDIAESHRDKMFTTMIRTASDLKNAITKKEDLFSYKKSNAKDDYDSLTKEIMGLDKAFERKGRKEASL